jgi:6-methylsalicylate decarboxylase
MLISTNRIGNLMKIDVHQHLWTESLVQALAARSELPFVRREQGLTVLYLAGERPYVIDLPSEAPAHRAALVELDGLDRALVCLSSPLGIEWLPREQALVLIDAYHEGALSLEDPFGVWGAIALDRADPDDVDRALARGCVGLSLPAGALASVEAVAGLYPLLARLESHSAPLLVHPGSRSGIGAARGWRETSLGDPLWWPALTGYVAGMQAAWLAFTVAGRSRHPRLRVVFSMLAGLAPLHAERLSSRGGPRPSPPDPLVFYDTSSYGPAAVRLLEDVVGPQQLLYGSDRPVVEPGELGMPEVLAWEPIVECTRRAFGATQIAVAR